MRIVAIRADHLAFIDRVVRGHLRLGAPLLVAGVADLGLGAFVAHLVLRRVHLVAGGAIHIAALVRAAHPVHASGVLLVAGQTDAALVVRSASFFERFDFQGAGVIVLTGDFIVRGAATVA